jgi:actin-like ATPase involved in cell morphogenesis
MDILLARSTKLPVRVAEDPEKCVAIGTARAFGYLDQLTDGFINTPTYSH